MTLIDLVRHPMEPGVLVPYDGSDPAHEALLYAFELFPKGEFVVLAAVDGANAAYRPDAPGAVTDTGLEEELLEIGEERLQAAQAAADDAGRTIETVVKIGPPAGVIVEFSESEDIDHIVMGSRGRTGLTRVLLGSVAETVCRRSGVPVTVVR